MGCGASSTKKAPQGEVASPTAPGNMNQTTQMNKQTDLQAAAGNVGRAVNEPSHTAAMTDTQRVMPGQNGAGIPPKQEEAKPADKPANEYDRMVEAVRKELREKTQDAGQVVEKLQRLLFALQRMDPQDGTSGTRQKAIDAGAMTVCFEVLGDAKTKAHAQAMRTALLVLTHTCLQNNTAKSLITKTNTIMSAIHMSTIRGSADFAPVLDAAGRLIFLSVADAGKDLAHQFACDGGLSITLEAYAQRDLPTEAVGGLAAGLRAMVSSELFTQEAARKAARHGVSRLAEIKKDDSSQFVQDACEHTYALLAALMQKFGAEAKIPEAAAEVPQAFEHLIRVLKPLVKYPRVMTQGLLGVGLVASQEPKSREALRRYGGIVLADAVYKEPSSTTDTKKFAQALNALLLPPGEQ